MKSLTLLLSLSAATTAAAPSSAVSALASRLSTRAAELATGPTPLSRPRAGARAIFEEIAREGEARKQRLRRHIDVGDFDPVRVSTTYGTLVGLGDSTVNQFLGVPFAAPPVGPLRWRQPQPPASWSGDKNATWFGKTCMQTEGDIWGIDTGTSEDCLYLNIYVPSNGTKPPGGYPVMLFLYGGSFTFGGASFPLYDGDTDVAIAEDAIVVATNYRLNVFGFLAGDELKAESADGSYGNYGLQDQRAAMQYIAQEIAAFGGDPKRLTIFGESAGGASVSNHLVSPRSRGLFAGAMIESGSFSDWSSQPYNISRTRLPQVAKHLGCATGPTLLACLRAVNETALLAADRGLTEGQLEWGPTIDGVEVVDDPRTLAAAGLVAPVPVLLGFNADEGTLFDSAPTNLNASDYLAAVETIIGPDLAPRIVEAYPAAQYESPWWAISAILRDSQMLCPGLQTAGWLSARSPPQQTFVYFYTQILLITDIIDLFRELRCFHGSELVSVFDFALLLLGPGEPDMARAFVKYWSNFAVHGDPNGPGLPTWGEYRTGGSGSGGAVAQIATSAAGVNVTMTSGLRAVECALWRNITIPPSVIWGSP